MTQIGVPTNYRDPVLHKDLVGCLRYQASGACAVESMEGSSGFNLAPDATIRLHQSKIVQSVCLPEVVICRRQLCSFGTLGDQ